MDYGPFIQQHRRKRADVTIAVKQVPLGEAHRFGILALDDNDQVVEWQEKPKQPRSDLASLGIYVFSQAGAPRRGSPRTAPTSARNVIPAMLDGGARVFGHRFEGYWQDVGTVDSYWRAQMELLDDHPQLDLYDRDWVIHTRSEERAPARIGPTASVHRSLISHGCLIAGTVERSVLSPGVRVDPGAIVRDSVIMFDCHIRAGAVVDRAILDKYVSVGPNAVVGMGDDFTTPNKAGADPPQHGHHPRGQARRHPGRGAHRAQRAHRRGRPERRLLVPDGAQRRQRDASRGPRRGPRVAQPRERDAAPTGMPPGRSAPGSSTRRRRDRRRWLAELGLAPVERADREGVSSWDLLARRAPPPRHPRSRSSSTRRWRSLCWVHYAPPINDSFRVSYRMLLRWNDELPFVKFAVSEDERPVLTAELPVATLDRDALGTALARLVAVCDLLLLDSARWLEPPGGRRAPGPPRHRAMPSPLLERYADRAGRARDAPG